MFENHVLQMASSSTYAFFNCLYAFQISRSFVSPCVCCMLCRMRLCRILQSILLASDIILIPLASSQQNLYDIYLLLCVQCQTPDNGHRNWPKHIEFHSKNKFEKLVHLVRFIIRIYHDVRSSECQIVIHCSKAAQKHRIHI